jgi:hypothetical protein
MKIVLLYITHHVICGVTLQLCKCNIVATLKKHVVHNIRTEA